MRILSNGGKLASALGEFVLLFVVGGVVELEGSFACACVVSSARSEAMPLA